MTELRFRARGTDGRVAIYTGSDDAPFDAPLSNLARVQFHSDLLYPKIIAEQSGSISMPARAENAAVNATYNLFAHGRSGTPLVIGYVTLGGIRVHLCGSVPVQWSDTGYARWISIGADATYVKIAEVCFTQYQLGFSSISVSWRAYVLDTLF